MIKLTSELMDSLLLQQDIEFRSNFASTNRLLVSTIVEASEPELLAAGLHEISSNDPRRRILGIRLMRELKQHSPEAAAALSGMLESEQNPEVMYWVVGAFGFLKSDSVTDLLLRFVDHSNPGVRYNTATALSNRASNEIPADSVDALLTLAQDENSEVRFSAIFELGSWWKVNRNPRIGSALIHIIDTDSDGYVVRAAQDALQGNDGQ